MAKKNEEKVTGELVTLEELGQRIESGIGFYDFCNGGLPKSPTIVENQTLTILGLSKAATYLAYLDTFCTNADVASFIYTTTSGVEVFAVEEHHTGQYCVLRDDGKLVDLAFPEDPAKGVPIIAILAICYWLEHVKAASTDYDLMSRSLKDVDWQGEPDVWMVKGRAVNKILGDMTGSLKKVLVDWKDEKIQLRKIKMAEEKMLPPHCDTAKYFTNTTSIEKYGEAQDMIDAKIFGIKKPGTLRECLEALPKLMDRNQMIEEQKFHLHDYDEEEFKGFVFNDWHFHALLGIGVQWAEGENTFRNLIFYGPAGTGKSTARMVISLAYDLPDWGSILCSSEMGKGNFIGEFTVTTDDTGIESQRLVWKPSCLLNCLRYGGIVELQEPSCIRDPGVLPCLNEFLAPTGWIEIPETGERFKRHPNSVVILSTNLEYAGCRELNFSSVSRMDMPYFVPGLTEAQMVERAQKHGISFSNDLLKKMAHAFALIIDLVDKDGIHGECSYRRFFDWCKYTAIYGDVLEAAEASLIHAAAFSSSEEEKAKIRQVIHSVIQKPEKVATLKPEFEALRALISK